MMNSLVNFSLETYTMLAFGLRAEHAVADRVHQVGLAQTDAAVEKERIVGHGRRLGHRLRGGVGEPVRISDDEIVEGVARVEVADAQLVGERRPARAGTAVGTLSVPGPASTTTRSAISAPRISWSTLVMSFLSRFSTQSRANVVLTARTISFGVSSTKRIGLSHISNTGLL